MSLFYPGEVIIDDTNFSQFLPTENPEFGFGLVPRDYGAVPVGSIDGISKFDMPLIPMEEWSSRIKDMEQASSRLSDMSTAMGIKHLDQNGQGYCWAYSVGAALTAARARDNQPYVRFSPHGPACKIKNFRDQGGWNPQAVEFAIKNGYPTIATWPEKSMSRRHDNQVTWNEAAKYKVTEGFMDLTPAVYDRNLSFQQVMTCVLCRIPCPVDFNWWGHSVCAMDPVEFDSSLRLSDMNRWGLRIWNSWVGWGSNSFGTIRGNKAIPNGATAIRVAS